MSKAQELRVRRSELIRSMQSLTDKADAEKRDFNSDEEKEFNEKEAEVSSINKRIEREERMATLEGAVQPTRAVSYEPADDTRGVQVEQKNSEKRTWGCFSEFLQAVVDASTPGKRFDPRLRENRGAASGLGEGISSDGGFIVQSDFANELLARVYTTGALASRVRRVPISAQSNGLKINVLDETSRANGSRFGGVRAYWLSEADAYTSSKPKLRQMELKLQKLGAICYLTDELMADGTALQSVVEDAFVKEMAFAVDDAILNGDGAGKPLGILKSGALVSVAKEANQTAATVNKDNIVKMRARLFAANRANSVWFINQAVEPQLNLLTLGDLGVYFPAGSLANAPEDRLFGRPVLPIEQCAALGTVGDIVLADLGEYLMIDKGSVQMQSSIHVRFLYDEQVLKFTYRVDGQPVWNSALTPYKGSDTLSPYVALATRA